jgi:hypothetical protein
MRLYTSSGIGYALRPPVGLPQARNRIYRGVGRLGQDASSATLLARPGPGGVGTELVYPDGNTAYTADQVAADPSLVDQLSSSGVCSPPLVPTWYPGGQSECAMPGAQGGGQIQGAPLNTCSDPTGICEGDVYQGVLITTPGQLPVGALPSAYTSPAATASQPAGLVAPLPLPAPTAAPAPAANLAPPTTGTGNPLAGSNAGSSTTGITPGTTVNGSSTSPAPAAETCSGIGWGPCVGPLDAGTWGLIAAGAFLVFMMMERRP